MAWPSSTISVANLDAGTDSVALARAQLKEAVDALNIIINNRGQATGIAPTDATNKVPLANLPTIPANQGGTGQTAYAVGDLLFASSTTALSKLAVGASGTALISNGAGVAPSWQVAGGFPSGTRLAFQQTTAPPGWTKETNAFYNDAILRFVTGTTGFGGANGFTSFNFQGSVGSTVLTLEQIPSHTHGYQNEGGAGSGFGYNASIGAPGKNTFQTQAAGGSQGHTHTITANIKYADFIIAIKD